MDEVRNLLGEFFFSQGATKQPGPKEADMKYPRKYTSLSEFEREELCAYKVNWSLDDFFDDVFLSGEMDMEFGEDRGGGDDEQETDDEG